MSSAILVHLKGLGCEFVTMMYRRMPALSACCPGKQNSLLSRRKTVVTHFSPPKCIEYSLRIASGCSHGLLHRCHKLVLIHGLLKERDCAALDGAGFSHQWVLSGYDDDRDITQGGIGF